MIGELQDQQQVTAATPAAARQTMPAAGASGELRSQAKNQAFPSFLNSSGISEMSRPGIYTFASCPVKMLRKIFFAENWDFIPKVELSISGRARCLLSHASGTKMAETLVFLREFRSLTAGPAGHTRAAGDPGRWVRELFWEFTGVFEEFRGASIPQLRTGRPAPGLIHRISTDFFVLGSLGV